MQLCNRIGIIEALDAITIITNAITFQICFSTQLKLSLWYLVSVPCVAMHCNEVDKKTLLKNGCSKAPKLSSQDCNPEGYSECQEAEGEEHVS